MNADQIREAEHRVTEMQEALSAVQTGLQRMESASTAAEAMKARSERMLRITLGLVGISILLALRAARTDRHRE